MSANFLKALLWPSSSSFSWSTGRCSYEFSLSSSLMSIHRGSRWWSGWWWSGWWWWFSSSWKTERISVLFCSSLLFSTILFFASSHIIKKIPQQTIDTQTDITISIIISIFILSGVWWGSMAWIHSFQFNFMIVWLLFRMIIIIWCEERKREREIPLLNFLMMITFKSIRELCILWLASDVWPERMMADFYSGIHSFLRIVSPLHTFKLTFPPSICSKWCLLFLNFKYSEP